MLLISAKKVRSLEIGQKDFVGKLRKYVKQQVPLVFKVADYLSTFMLLLLIFSWVFRNGLLRYRVSYLDNILYEVLYKKVSDQHESMGLSYSRLAKHLISDDNLYKLLNEEILEAVLAYEQDLEHYIREFRRYYRVSSYVFYFACFAVTLTFFAPAAVYFYKKYAQRLILFEIRQFIWDIVIKLSERLRQKHIELLRNINQSIFCNLARLFQEKYSESDLSQLSMVFFLFSFAVIFLSVLIDYFYNLLMGDKKHESGVKIIFSATMDVQGSKDNKIVERIWILQLSVAVIGCIIFVVLRNLVNKKSIGLFRDMIHITQKITNRVINTVSSGNRQGRLIQDINTKNDGSIQKIANNLQEIRSQVINTILLLTSLVALSIISLTIALWKLRFFSRVIEVSIQAPKRVIDILQERNIAISGIDEVVTTLKTATSLVKIFKNVIIAIFILILCFVVFMVVSILANLSRRSEDNDNLGKTEAHSHSLAEIKRDSDTLPSRTPLWVKRHKKPHMTLANFGFNFPLNFDGEGALLKVEQQDIVPGIYITEGRSGSGKTTIINAFMHNFFKYFGILFNRGVRAANFDFVKPDWAPEAVDFREPWLDDRHLMDIFGVPHHFRLEGIQHPPNLVIAQQLNIPNKRSLTEDFLMEGSESDGVLLSTVADDLDINHLLGKRITARSLTPQEQFRVLVARSSFYFLKNKNNPGFVFLDEMLTGANYKVVEKHLNKLMKNMLTYVKLGGVIFIIDHTKNFEKALKKSSCREYTKKMKISNEDKSLRVTNL